MEVSAKTIDAKNDPDGSAKTSFFSSLNFGIVPALVVAILPKCPLCFAAYLSAFGLFGISPLQYGSWILPLVIFFSAVTIVIFFRQARRNAGYDPFFLSLTGLTLISVGKFYFENDWLMYAGIAILFISAAWLSKAKRKVCRNNC